MPTTLRKRIRLQDILPQLKLACYLRKSLKEEDRDHVSVKRQWRQIICDIFEEYFPSLVPDETPKYEEEISGSWDRRHNKKKERPEFQRLIADILRGIVNAIACWRINRLARNEVDAAKIMELYRTGKLLAIFTVHDGIFYKKTAKEFEELNELFKKACHYSDDLMENVNDGMEDALLMGKSSGTVKHGYIRTGNGKYIPSDHKPNGTKTNFEIIKELRSLMATGIGDEDGFQFLQDEGYHWIKKKDGSRVYPRQASIVANIRKDKIGYGILEQSLYGEIHEINLLELPGYNFKTMCTEEDYAFMNKPLGRRGMSLTQEAIFNPYKDLVKCECGAPTFIDYGKGKGGKKWLYLRCNKKKKCPLYIEAEKRRKQAGAKRLDIKVRTRLSVVNTAVSAEIKRRWDESDIDKQEMVRAFQEHAKQYINDSYKNMKDELKQLRTRKAAIEAALKDHRIKGIETGLNRMDPGERNLYEEIKTQMIVDLDEVDNQITQLSKDNPLKTFEYEKVVQPLENGFCNINEMNVMDKNHFMKIIWSNLTVFNDTVGNFEWNPVIDKLFYPPNVDGGPGGSRTPETVRCLVYSQVRLTTSLPTHNCTYNRGIRAEFNSITKSVSLYK